MQTPRACTHLAQSTIVLAGTSASQPEAKALIVSRTADCAPQSPPLFAFELVRRSRLIDAVKIATSALLIIAAGACAASEATSYGLVLAAIAIAGVYDFTDPTHRR